MKKTRNYLLVTF